MKYVLRFIGYIKPLSKSLWFNGDCSAKWKQVVVWYGKTALKLESTYTHKYYNVQLLHISKKYMLGIYNYTYYMLPVYLESNVYEFRICRIIHIIYEIRLSCCYILYLRIYLCVCICGRINMKMDSLLVRFWIAKNFWFIFKNAYINVCIVKILHNFYQIPNCFVYLWGLYV